MGISTALKSDPRPMRKNTKMRQFLSDQKFGSEALRLIFSKPFHNMHLSAAVHYTDTENKAKRLLVLCVSVDEGRMCLGLPVLSHGGGPG